MGRYYILRDGEVIEEPNHAKWSEWYAESYNQLRCIARTELKYGTVSTIFLGMNMTLAQSDPPLLFETRVEGGWLADQWQRYPTLADARAGHEAWVARVREIEEENELPPPGYPVW
jgi:hypothetical protein